MNAQLPRKGPAVSATLLAGIAIGVVGLLVLTRALAALAPTLTLFLAAGLMSYILYPAVRRLSLRMPVAWAIGLVFALLALAVVAAVAFIVPPLLEQGTAFAGEAPKAVARVQVYLQQPDSVVTALPLPIRHYLQGLPNQLESVVQSYAGALAASIIAFTKSTMRFALTLIAVPVIAAYLMYDARRMHDTVLRIVPRHHRPRAIALLRDIDRVLTGAIRGQVLVAGIVGLLIGAALTLVGVRYGLVIGLLAGALDVVPYIGGIAAFVPAIAFSLLDGGPLQALIACALIATIFLAEAHVFGPRIVGANVGLHPLAIIFAILAGGQLFGLAGMYLAVPVAAMAVVAAPYLLYTYEQVTSRALKSVPPRDPRAGSL